MNLLTRLAPPRIEARSVMTVPPPSFTWGGTSYPMLAPSATTFANLVTWVHDQDNVVSAAVAARAFIMSQVRFAWRNRADRALMFDARLGLLERPDPGAMTRPQLLSAMETHASYAGSAFVAVHPDRLELLNPELVDVQLAGVEDPGAVVQHRAGRKTGFVYWRGGREHPELSEPWPLERMIHWCPEPHPVRWWTGCSWVTSLLTEIAVDRGAKQYATQYLSHAATPNMIIKPHERMTPEDLERYQEIFAAKYAGSDNAFKTLWLGGGADVEVVGGSLADLDLRALQGGGETRVAVRSRVPAAILGIREGLAGSALNAGNYSATRRLWADGWYSPAVQSLCAATESAFAPKPGAEMWHDDADVLLLQEDAKDAAEIMSTNATALQALDSAGYSANAAVAAVRDGNLSALIGAHDGLQSVQRQPPAAPDPVRAIRAADAITIGGA